MLTISGSAGLAQSGGGGAVAGNLVVKDKGGKRAGDTDQAVIWLERVGAPPATPRRLEIPTRSKEFVPHVLVVPTGSIVAFPNRDLVARQAVRARSEQRLATAREAVANTLAARALTLRRVTEGLV